MKRFLVSFELVGRANLSWSQEMDVLTHDSLSRAVHMKRAILSRHPDFEIDDSSNTGLIVAGFRTVGKFTFIDRNN